MKMEEFISDAKCPYAILSHTWGEEEVSFQKYSTPEARSMAGYRKIERSCALASESGLPYLWIDTCCIDKSSSAELSEAINSMYRWYRDAAVCYVHLSDMKRCEVYQNPYEDENPASTDFQTLQACRWFTRGWTLQELLAPQNVEFYDQDWVSIGTKKIMWRLLSRITGIRPVHLWKSQEASVAQKMSWAANRQTTRTEDLAYSLLGLFNVNMPLLYGEGEKAFKRLQHEILQSTNDESIFAWTDDQAWTSGLLAESPANFADSGDFIPSTQFYRRPYTITNQGLQIELRYSSFENEEAGRFETPLRCIKGSILDMSMLSLHMTYYADEMGALRALRTGPSQVGVMETALVHGTRNSDSFHIDDFRHPKLPPHWETPLYSNLFPKVSCFNSLTLRLSGRLDAEDICISQTTGTTGEGSFSIVNRDYLGSPSNMYVYWSDDRTYLTFGIRPVDPSRFDSTQELFKGNKWPLSDFKLQAGNSLATWFSTDQILFIALSNPRSREACIDIQLDGIHDAAECFNQLTKADPLRVYKAYPPINLITLLDKISLPSDIPSDKGSGKEMYGRTFDIDP